MSGNEHQTSRNNYSRSQSYTGNQYAARVYNAANAAAMAAQPLLGYLGAGSTPQSASVPRTVVSDNVKSHPYVAESSSRPEAVAGGASSPSRADTPNLPTGTAMRRAASTDEDSRRKDSRNLDSIISQFFSKAAQIIVQARLTHLQAQHEVLHSAAGQGANKRTRNRWFNLEMDEVDVFKEELKTWRSVTSILAEAAARPGFATSGPGVLVPSMVIDVILDVSDMSGNQVLVLNDANREGRRLRVDLSRQSERNKAGGHAPATDSPRRCNILLEQWTLVLRPPAPAVSPELPSVYKHCIILFRALFTLVRALPAFDLYRKQRRSTSRSELKIGCRMSAKEPESPISKGFDSQVFAEEDRLEIGIDEPLSQESSAPATEEYAFSPIVTPLGLLDLKCKYRSAVDFSVEEIEALLSSRFLDEDFFKPTMRKYSSGSGVGSLPIRGSTPMSAQPSRQSYGSPISRQVVQRDSPSTSQASLPRPNETEGAFITYGRASGAQAMARGLSAQGTPPLQRRPSTGTSHPCKPSSSPLSGGSTARQTSSPSPVEAQTLTERYSASQRLSNTPASAGTSALRYTSPRQAPPTSSSQLSYTKQTISPPEGSRSPMSGLSALQIGTPPARPESASNRSPTQPIAMPGTSAIPLSSSPTPSLIKRYSSSRYSRSYGQHSSSSSPSEAQGPWAAEGSVRHSRMSSDAPTRNDSLLSSESSSARYSGNPAGKSADLQGGGEDNGDIRSFLAMIDSHAQIGHSRPGQSITTASSPLGGASFGRAQAEERLRLLARSVYQDQNEEGLPTTQGARPLPITRHIRSRSGDGSTFAPSTRHSPSPDLHSISPAEGTTYLASASSATAASIRVRASQPPMSSSIPEEESHMSAHPSSYSRARGEHFPFPRYQSTRRRSSQGSDKARPSLLGLDPDQRRSNSSQSITSSVTQQGDSAGASPALSHYETGEEQIMAQMDFGSDHQA